MIITGTHFNYYLVCKRKLWLFANGIQMEHTSESVAEGKLIHETAYPQRSERYEEIEMDGIMVDFYDARQRVIHEIKKTNKIDDAHILQLKYYIYVFERNGIKDVTGILEYPTQRTRETVTLTDDDRKLIAELEKEILSIIESENCPTLEKRVRCKNCSYYDFCFCNEDEPV